MKIKKLFNQVFGYLVLGFLALLAVAMFVGLFLLKQWRWSCGG